MILELFSYVRMLFLSFRHKINGACIQFCADTGWAEQMKVKPNGLPACPDCSLSIHISPSQLCIPTYQQCPTHAFHTFFLFSVLFLEMCKVDLKVTLKLWLPFSSADWPLLSLCRQYFYEIHIMLKMPTASACTLVRKDKTGWRMLNCALFKNVMFCDCKGNSTHFHVV